MSKRRVLRNGSPEPNSYLDEHTKCFKPYSTLLTVSFIFQKTYVC